MIIALFFLLYFNCLNSRYKNAFKGNNYCVKIISLKQESKYKNRYVVKLLDGNNKNLKAYLYTKKDKNFCYGDILKVEGEIESPQKARNDKGFARSDYYIYASKIKFIKNESNIFSVIYNFKAKCINILNENFNEEEASILIAMLLGDKNNINSRDEEMFTKSNLAHILAISGLHITYVVWYIEKALKKFVNNIKVKNLIIIIIMFLFMIFVGASPSVMRACIMTMITYIGKIFLAEKDVFTSLLLSFIIIIFINPYNIFSISLWLSFLGILGIILFNSFFEKILTRKLKVKTIFAKYLLSVIIASVSAQILIFPVIWKCFGTISFNFWISNLLVSEFVAPILIMGYMSIILFPFRKFIVMIEKIVLNIFLYLVSISSKIPFNQVYFPIPSNYLFVIYYCLIFGLVFVYKQNKIYVLKCVLNFKFFKKALLKYKNTLKNLLIIFIAICMLAYIYKIAPKDLRINFLDVRSRRLYNY